MSAPDLRPEDWGERARCWILALSGEQRKAIVLLLGPETPEGQTWARLVYSAALESSEERNDRILKTEGAQAARDFLDWLNR